MDDVKPEAGGAADLILTQPEEEDKADALLASLSTLAFATTDKPQSKELESKSKAVIRKPKRDFDSRFFFKIEPSFAAEIQAKKKQFKPKALEHIDAEVEARLADYKNELPAELKANIELVREFFLKELAPLTLAGSAGTGQAQQVIQRLLGSPIQGDTFAKYEMMMKTASNIQTARFIARFIGLPKSYIPQILATLNPRPPLTFPVPSSGNAAPQQVPQARPHEPRHLRNKAAKIADQEHDI